MADVFSTEERSRIMSRVRGGNTRPEKIVRSFLHAHGFRFRLHDRSLPGKPDIVLRRHHTVVLVNGCFWHGHGQCRKGRKLPEANAEFWRTKIAQNKARDGRAKTTLQEMGWNVVVIWECEAHTPEGIERALQSLFNQQQGTDARTAIH